jgi:hypothetical protein
VGPAVRAANADAKPTGPRPGFSLDDRSQLTIAAVAPFRRFALVLVGQARFPVDVIFF